MSPLLSYTKLLNSSVDNTIKMGKENESDIFAHIFHFECEDSEIGKYPQSRTGMNKTKKYKQTKIKTVRCQLIMNCLV